MEIKDLHDRDADYAGAVRIVLQSCRGCRLPEPVRQAHLPVDERRLSAGGGSGANGP